MRHDGQDFQCHEFALNLRVNFQQASAMPTIFSTPFGSIAQQPRHTVRVFFNPKPCSNQGVIFFYFFFGGTAHVYGISITLHYGLLFWIPNYFHNCPFAGTNEHDFIDEASQMPWWAKKTQPSLGMLMSPILGHGYMIHRVVGHLFHQIGHSIPMVALTS